MMLDALWALWLLALTVYVLWPRTTAQAPEDAVATPRVAFAATCESEQPRVHICETVRPHPQRRHMGRR